MSGIEALVQYLANGLYLGSDYLLLALGITLVFGVMEIGDVAQGGLFALGAYLAYAITVMLGLPYGLALVAAPAAGAGISALLGRGLYQRLRQFGIGPTFIGAVSLLLVIQSLLAAAFGEGAQTVPSPFGIANVRMGPIGLFGHKLFAIGVAAVLALTLWRGLQSTRWGKAVRALAQNREAAILSGVNVGAVSMLAFALAGGLSGLAGAVTAPVAPFTPFIGRLAIIKAFAISRIGRGSIRAVIGLALLLGVAESLTAAYLSAEYSDLLPLGLLILVMLLRIETLGPEEHLTATRSTMTASETTRVRLPSWAWLTGGSVVLALPILLAAPPFVLHLLIMAGILAICVASADLLYGLTGLPSLAQGAFWGVGAYASALLMMRLGAPPLVSLAGTLAMTLVIGAIVGALGVRAGRHWTLFTFIATVLFTLLALSLDGITGGPNGLTGVPWLAGSMPLIGDVSFNPFLHKAAYYGLIAVSLFGVLGLKSLIVRSWFGRALVSIREDEGLARSIGIPARRYKIAIFSLSASIAGFGGFLYAHYLTYLHPDLFDFISSFNILMMNKIGGLATALGPVLAPLAVTAVDELTRPINAYISEIVFGVLLILTILYLPGGLVGGGRRLIGRLRPKRPASTVEETS